MAKKNTPKISPDRFKPQAAAGTVRLIKVKFLLVCEGEATEPNYFYSFHRKAKNILCDVEPISIKGKKQPDKIVEEAIRLKNTPKGKTYDRIWVVFDKDDASDAKFNKAIQDATKAGIAVAWTNEAFELWYVLHFQYRNTPMSREDYQKAIEAEINKEKKGRKKYKYEKNDPNMHSLLEEHGCQETAIRNAEKLLELHPNNGCTSCAKSNPCTTVHKLVRELNNDSPEISKIVKKKMGVK